MIDEALRYMGVTADPAGEVRGRLEELAAQLRQRVRPRHVLRVLTLERSGGALTLGGLLLPGELAAAMLADCDRAALMVCTLGAAFDGWMRTEQARDMTRALMLDALGSALVEEGCDEAERALSARFPGRYLTDRFSPGYGDLPLTLQPEILAAADAGRLLGVHATQSCLLVPQKTVTAVIGIADRPQRARIRGCAHCPMGGDCAYRKGGTTCEV